VIELRPQHSLACLLKAAGLSRSTFYYQHKVLQLADKYAEVKERIGTIYAQHKGRYGYRRITATLRSAGTTINHKTVQRLMDQLRLKSCVRMKKYRAFKGDVGHAAENVLARDFKASRPNEKWVTDVTEFNVGGEKLYLSPILDLFNGEIVSYEIARRPLLNMVTKMLESAFQRLRPSDKPILHSDQGWQYRMEKYSFHLKRRSVTQSMSRRGNCLDNAVMESFFGTLKSEFFHLTEFTSLDGLKAGLDEYIRYYNVDRIKQRLNYLSPVAFRLQFT
jgi:putative transposase